MNYEQRKQHTDDQMRELICELKELEADDTRPNLDDFVLAGRIDELTNGAPYSDPFRESKSELAVSVMKTITSQFSTGAPSPEAIRYVADRFSAYLNSLSGIDSLDGAFFLESKNPRGGQVKVEADELEVCQAYESVLMDRTHHFDKGTKTMEIGPVTREILYEAEQMATEAHYGKSIARLEHWQGKFTRTVRPILQKHGVIKKKVNTRED
jgi:hypothetical protein